MNTSITGITTTPERRQIDWFKNKLQDRYLCSAAAHLVPSAVAFLLSALLLQISPLHPLITLTAFGSVLASWRTWIFLIFQMLLNAVAFVIAYNLIDVKRAVSSHAKRRMIYLTMLGGYISIANSLITIHLLDVAKNVYWSDGQPSILSSPILLLIFGSVLIASLKSALCSSYLFSFPSVEQSWGERCSSLCRFSRDSFLFEVFLQALSAIKWTIGILVIFVFPYLYFGAIIAPSFSESLWSLLSVRGLFTALVATYRVVLVQRFAAELISIFVMKPISFKTPPAYQVIGAPTDSYYLHTALNSTYVMLKYFAFWDLRRLSIGSRHRRAELFILSQPGGHPRNWQEVSQACLALLTEFQRKLHAENSQLGVQSSKSMDSTKSAPSVVDRSAMLVPSHLQMRTLKNARDTVPVTRNWHFDQNGLVMDEAAKKRTLSYWQQRFFELLRIDVTKSRVEPPLTDAYLVVWSLEALSLLVFHSYEEDAYGVVQKDLATILGCLLDLYAVLERNMRLKQMRAGQQMMGDVIVSVDQTLTAALNRVLTRFGSHISALDLPADQRALLATLSRT
uniref:Nucleoporin NDC1 n=1 Tax=Plectus sambesii TaxID=2011161 RepID=A0A914WUU1_9BILA